MRINDKNKTMDMEVRDINFILPPYIRSYLFYSKNEMPTKIVFPMFASVDILGADGQLHPLPIEWISPTDPRAIEIAKDGEVVAEVTPEQEAAIDEKEAETEALKAKMTELTELPEVCGAYAESWKELGKPEGWAGCSLAEGHEGLHKDDTIDILPAPAPEDLIRQQEETAAEEYEAEHGDTPRRPAGSVSPAKAAFAEPPATPPAPAPDRKPKQPPGGDIGPGQALSGMGPRDAKDQIQTARDLKDEPDIKEEEQVPFEKEVSRDEAGKPVVEDKLNE